MPLALQILFRRSDAPNEPLVNARIANLSHTGLCLNTGNPIAVGQVLCLVLEGGPESTPLLGRVVWQVAQPDGRSRAGIKFVNVQPEDAARLRKWMDG